jgi:hypothetical protein
VSLRRTQPWLTKIKLMKQDRGSSEPRRIVGFKHSSGIRQHGHTVITKAWDIKK